MTSWQDKPMPQIKPGLAGWVRIVLRGGVLGAVVYLGLLLLLLVRLVERPLHGLSRPWSPYITQAVCRAAFPILGIRFDIRGRPMSQKAQWSPTIRHGWIFSR